eukprot:SAG31_NODE_7355_length_1711_cov_3.477667_2_plen_359_part_00
MGKGGGGHGGLNILPQKSWNVYNYDNRLQVEKDEAAHAAQQEELLQKTLAADQEHRMEQLRARLIEKRAANSINGDVSAALSAESDHAEVAPGARQQSICFDYQAGRCTRGSSCKFLHAKDAGDALDVDRTGHVNFFAREEQNKRIAGQNEDYLQTQEKMQQREARRDCLMLGQTAGKFGDRAEAPWYLSAESTLPTGRAEVAAGPTDFCDRVNDKSAAETSDDGERTKRRRPALSLPRESADSDPMLAMGSYVSAKRRRDSSRKEEKKRQRIESMRAERLARERQERDRAAALIRQRHPELFQQKTTHANEDDGRTVVPAHVREHRARMAARRNQRSSINSRSSRHAGGHKGGRYFH